jgi:hypothetical protein
MNIKKYYLIVALLLIWMGVFSQNTNIMIDNTYDANEPTIMMDPKNPDRLMAGANINKLYISTDGGYKWKIYNIGSSYGVWGDPCIAVDTNGYFYYFHLSYPPKDSGSWIDRIVCQKITSDAGKWNNGSYTGLNGTKVQDKEWAYVDRKNNNIYTSWTQFDDYKSTDPKDSSIIRFSKSEDGGKTWMTPVRISRKAGDCLDGDFTAEGAVPCAGPDGEIYLSWANAGVIYFDRSTDGGHTWLDNDIVVCQQPGSWDITINGIYRANGMPVTCSDLSNGPLRGTVYINFCAQRTGMTDTDVWLTKSTDGGFTWNEPVRVNDGPEGTQQFLSWMTVDQATGYIYIVFYDRRNYNDTRTDVYLAWSNDGGETFENQKISDTPFTPDPNVFFGDYTNITAYNGKVVPIWTRTDNSINSVWCTIINNAGVGINESGIRNKQSGIKVYPNPANSLLVVSYQLIETSQVDIRIYDITDRVIDTLVDGVKDKGEYSVKYNSEDLKSGIYFITIKTQNNIERKKIVIIDN